MLWIAPVTPDDAGGAAFVAAMREYADLGVEQVHVMPFGADPVTFIEGLGAHVVGGLTALG